MSRKNRIVNVIVVISFSILTSLAIVGCMREYPPFDEYQVAGFVPIDALQQGELFITGDRLFALYDTLHYNRWSLLREYDISDPVNLQLLSTEELSPPLEYYFDYQDSLAFFQMHYHNLVIFNLNARESHTLTPDYSIFDIAHSQHYLFVSGHGGFRVWDISNLPSYIEVFNDSIAHYSGFVVLRDTILLEIYREVDYRFKFWNVKNPEQPQVIGQGDLPNSPNQLYYIGMTDQFIICFASGVIHRYQYDLPDSLIYEDALYLDFSYYRQRTSDSLIYVADHMHLDIIRVDDFSAQQIGVVDSYNQEIAAMEILGGRIYVMCRNKGILVYERRTP